MILAIILANLLCCQDLFSVCDNRYGHMIPCFIAGFLVVKSFVPICVLVVRVDHASVAVEVRFFCFNASFFILYIGVEVKVIRFNY